MTANVERAIRALPFSLPDITEAEIEAVVEVLRSGWLTTGPKVQEFQRAFAEYVGASHAVALNSATAALHLALDAIGLGPADEVIVPTYTFAASAEVIRYFGARPVLVDIRAEDLNLDVGAVERAVGPRTRAVMGVDLAGQPCDWHLLRPLADRYGFALVDDAAHALPSSLQGRAIGRWADLTAFSFYATKPLTTGEGGMLVTDNESWARRAQSMSLHGVSHDAWKRYSAEGSWYYEITAPGFKYNMTDIAAALGLVQLRRLSEMTARRASIADRYTAALGSLAELEVPSAYPDRSTSWHLYIVRLRLDRLRCDRNQFIDALSREHVGTSVHFIPLHLHPYYRETYGYGPDDFPVAYREYQRVVSLPIYSRMTNADVDRVIEAITRIVAQNRL
ncbi:MAG TPA: UDP-4-amino-4,6-dideoxy-N-acetyl-beta-L-altrosamine transaminase [Chloroflexi bacterium]|jgi:perosamine synthetase|nr:UDP-4-amino-4,6-dideoxy-N-acetyl-beta-L-altrosamine transaminase [Chloroflexota bacterium]